MKRMVIPFLAALVFITSYLDRAQAVTLDKPHDFTCATCHTPHKTLASTGYNNICLNCHRGGDPMAGAKSFAPGDAADPFSRYTSGVSNRYQISHRWDGADVNARAGATTATLAQMTSVRGRTSNEMACVRCHNPHSQENKPFLRTANAADQMCLDCHSSRNTTDQTKGTHPVGVDYQLKASANPAAYNAAPVNANAANPTSAMKLLGGKVSCSTCHGVHATDSNSSTFDSFSTLSDLNPSDGNLLRSDRRAATADGINICTNCHAGKSAHNGRNQNIQCSDCHGAHVDTGDGSVPNVWLVKRDMGAGKGTVQFTSTTAKNYMDTGGNGVCQSCHAVPTGSGYQFHLTETNATCNNCHAHGNSTGSFSVDSSKACNACHGYPPLLNSVGSGGYASGYNTAPSFTDESISGHGSHASAPYQKACDNCHKGNTHQDGIYQDVFNVSTGTVAATGLLAPVYDKVAQTCSSVYCHSNANPRGGGNITKTTPSWNGGKGKIIGTVGECGVCHNAAGDSLPTWSISHTRHVNGYAANPNFTCTTCHAGTASGNSAIFNNITARSLHTNGVKDVVFNSLAKGGSWEQVSGACSNLYCHSNVQGSGGVGAPDAVTSGLVWNGSAMTCGSCHAAMVTLSNISTATGSHKRHVQGYGFECSVCHGSGYSATGNSAPPITHVDGTITIGFTGTAATNGATPSYYQGNNKPGDGYKNCSSVYCHSNVQGSGGIGVPTTFAAPEWGAAPLPCGSCHANMAVSAAATGSHIQHVQTGGFSCPTCHNGAGKDPNPPFTATAKHADGTIEISFSGSAAGAVYSKGGSVLPGTGYGSCSNASCHADPYSSATVVTPVWGTGTTSGCAACHNGAGAFSGTGAGPATGSHNKHMAATVTCGDCHAGAVAGSTGGTAHGDNNIDVTNGYPANVAKHAAGTYTGTCSTACHSSTTAAVSTPVWGTTSTCSSCHDSAPATGSHSLHSGLSVQSVCIDCHAGAVIDTDAGTSHLNGVVNVTNGYPANVVRHAAGSYTGTCATASCHADPYGPSTVITPVWGVEIGNHCAGCHNGAGAFDAALGSPTTGSHAKHMALSGVLCNKCHAGAVKNTEGGSLHKNGTIDVTNGYPANVTKHAAGTYTGTCSTSVCHGAGNVPWGGTLWSTVDQCGTCHASNANGSITQAAPFYNTAFPVKITAADNAKVGAHTNHMTSQTLGVSASTACTDCHGTVTLSGATHMNGATTFVWSALATKSGTLSPVYDVATGQCVATYCHGNSMPGGDTGGTNKSPVWNNPNYLPAAINAAACGTCHGFPPSTLSGHPGGITIPAGFPATATIGTTCSCHSNINTAGNSFANIFVNPALHINGVFEPAASSHTVPFYSHATPPFTSCTGCHNASLAGSYPAPTAGTAPNCGGCHVTADPTVTSTGCTSCHANPPNGTTRPNVAGSHAKHSALVGTPNNCAICHNGAGAGSGVAHGPGNKGANPAVDNIVFTAAQAGASATWTGATKTCSTTYCHGATLTGGTAKNPVWGTTLTGCGLCHGDPPATATHAGVTVTQCINCHTHVNGAGTGFTNAALHINGTVEASGSCISCHASAQTGTHGTPRDAVTTEFGLAWGHKNNKRTPVTDADCIVCHLEGNYTTQSTSALHKDGNIDLRDPDGVGETAITNISGGTFTFTKFAISFAAGSRTTTGHTSNTDIANVITQKFCLACHDNNGATNSTARSNNGGTGTAMMPFGGVNLGATYTLLNGAAAAGGVVDAKTQFASANSSAHPVTGPRSKSYPTSTKLVAPYNNFTRTAGTKSDSVVMNCFDCHNETLTIASRITNRTIVAHGNALTIPGTLYAAAAGGNSVASPTFCLNCHIGGYNTTAQGHGTGSAISASNSAMSAARFATCANCHFSNGFKPARPLQAADIHGFNGLAANGGAWTYGNANGMRPVALIRNVGRWTTTSPRPRSAPGLTGTGSNCGGNMNTSTGGVSCNENMAAYTPGGAY